MTALPPDFDEDDEIMQTFRMKLPTTRDLAWRIVRQFAFFLGFVAVAAYIVQTCWSTLTAVTGLPDITWKEAFCALILLRVMLMASLPS